LGEKQPGLRMRMRSEARRVAAQHAQLDSFYARVRDALRRGEREEAGRAFGLYREALESHFGVEEQVFFPALRGLQPALDAELARLVGEHARFRARLAEIAQRLEGEAIDSGVEPLEALAAQLGRHEEREERMLDDVNHD